MLATYVPPDSSTVHVRLQDAGAVLLGKLNMDEFAMGSSTEHSAFFPTRNPWDLARSPGGSSGGAAAALAAGLTALDIGVDFGGGVRNVAHYCGIYGHKPTYGVTNWVGHVMPGIGNKPDLAVAGPLARSADDLGTALSLVAGPAPDDLLELGHGADLTVEHDEAAGLRIDPGGQEP